MDATTCGLTKRAAGVVLRQGSFGGGERGAARAGGGSIVQLPFARKLTAARVQRRWRLALAPAKLKLQRTNLGVELVLLMRLLLFELAALPLMSHSHLGAGAAERPQSVATQPELPPQQPELPALLPEPRLP